MTDALYTVFENKGPPVFSLLALFGLNFKGYEIAVKGTVKIIGFVEGTDQIYRARIAESVAPIKAGDRVRSGVPSYIVSQKGRPGSVAGRIIGSPRKSQKYLSVYSFVYLDKGLSDGIETGDIYSVRLNKTGDIQYPYLYERPGIGRLRVVHANPDTSTAVIVEARETIKIGDFFEPGSGVSGLQDSQAHEEIDPDEEEAYEEDDLRPPQEIDSAPESAEFAEDEADEPEDAEEEGEDEGAEEGGSEGEDESERDDEDYEEDTDPPASGPSDADNEETLKSGGADERPADAQTSKSAPSRQRIEKKEPDHKTVKEEPPDAFDEKELNEPHRKKKKQSLEKRRRDPDPVSPVPQEVKEEFQEIDEM